jgi:hypothetical protein
MKRLAGKKAFEAMGRRAASMGLPIHCGRLQRQDWKPFAKSAYARGWLLQTWKNYK